MAKTVHFMFHVYVTTTLKSAEWKRGRRRRPFLWLPRWQRRVRQLTGGHVPSPGAARPRERARASALAQHLPRWGGGGTSCTTNRPLASGGTQGGARAQARTPPGRPTRSGNSGLRTSAHERRGSGGPRPPGPRRCRWEDAERASGSSPRGSPGARTACVSRDGTQPGQGRTRRQRPRSLPSRSQPAATAPTCSPRPLRSDPRGRAHALTSASPSRPQRPPQASSHSEPEWAGRTG